jgi:hypothetical protein
MCHLYAARLGVYSRFTAALFDINASNSHGQLRKTCRICEAYWLVLFIQAPSLPFALRLAHINHNSMGIANAWQQCDHQVFWKAIAPADHVVQLYDDEAMLLRTLSAYAADGFAAGDCVIIIATAAHLETLDRQLSARGFSPEALRATDQFIPLNAEHTLAKFMVNGWPEEKYFMEVVTGLMKRARQSGREVRAFGEMVVLLWQKGNSSGTIQLEQLWNKFCAIETFCLLCAYPKSGFKHNALASVMHICSAHTKYPPLQF